MKLRGMLKLTILTLVVSCISLVGCTASRNYEDINSNIDAHGIVLGLDTKTVFTQLGEEPEQEMCVYGYEYTFEKSGLNIGFRLNDDTVRRVTIRNEEDSIFGLHVGNTLSDVSKLMDENNFEADTTVDNRYMKDSLYFTAISKNGVSIDQLIIEVIDDDVLK